MSFCSVKVLAFDVFGTVTDVWGSLLREASVFGKRKGVRGDWSAFADRWLSMYADGVAEVREGREWATVDALNLSALERLLPDFGLQGLTNEEKEDLNNAWHRLRPWPDSVEGLSRLRRRFRVVTLANANFTLLHDLAVSANLPWDRILSGEFVRRYKPDPEVYTMAVDCLRLPPDEIMMVAAHKYDLKAAKAVGLRTAFVERPRELGPHPRIPPDRPAPEDGFDLFASEFIDLAVRLGA